MVIAQLNLGVVAQSEHSRAEEMGMPGFLPFYIRFYPDYPDVTLKILNSWHPWRTKWRNELWLFVKNYAFIKAEPSEHPSSTDGIGPVALLLEEHRH